MAESKRFSLKEVAEHKTADSCWVVVHDKVYDLTPFFNEHPGGEEVLLEQAGQVATDAFEDVGHSTDAREMMTAYLVGELTDEDKKFTKDKGPKEWEGGKNAADDNTWMDWLKPVVIALVFSVAFRMYMNYSAVSKS
ncbi:Cytochrome b5-like heme/steroid binding domain [Trinorchestia longiramus]|nr:Cytochrome b5-like heme/steroid binding domain [Trinorchestia longiramus]